MTSFVLYYRTNKHTCGDRRLEYEHCRLSVQVHGQLGGAAEVFFILTCLCHTDVVSIQEACLIADYSMWF
jgi:hypothetical protein